MVEKIKKIKFLPLIFLFVLAGIFLPFQSALALSWLPKLIASALITLILRVFILLSVAFFVLAEWLLRFVLSPDFISVPYTTNAFVELGWSLTRDFVNMFFIIILVIIGLGTALRLGEYQWQKTLPRLILIALLINFSPVILGLIIDASNIIMNFFVSGISSENILSSQYDLYTSRMFSITEEPGWLEILLMPFVFIISNFITGVIYLAFAALFVMRYVALWMLIILSPLAFICYILPNTKGIWNMWWNQFTQWCIIGISAAFFLYLSDQLLYYFLTNPGMMANPDREGWGLLDAIVPYWVILAFLIFGLFSALSTSAIGAGGIISFAQRQTKAAGSLAVKRAERRTVAPVAGKTAKGISGLAKKTEKVPFLNWATRRLETAAVPSLTEYSAKHRRIGKPAGWDLMSIPEKEAYVRAQELKQDQLALASLMKDEGTFQKSSDNFKERGLKNADKFKSDPRYAKEASDIFEALPDKVTEDMLVEFKIAPLPRKDKEEARKKIKGQMNEIINEFDLNGEDEKDRNKAAQILHIRGLKPHDISGVAGSSLKSEPFRLALRKMQSNSLQSIRNSFDSETVDKVLNEEKGLNTINEQEFESIKKTNPSLVRWAYETPAGRETLNWSKEWPLEKKQDSEKPKILVSSEGGRRTISPEEMAERQRIIRETKKEQPQTPPSKRPEPDTGEGSGKEEKYPDTGSK